MEIAIISLIQAVLVALITRNSFKAKRAQKKAEAAAQLLAKESLLSMQLQAASVNLSLATAKAIQEGKTNGAMQIAYEEGIKAKSAYDAFLQETISAQLAHIK